MPDADRSLEQYRVLMSYLQYENSAYWMRANYFLLANSIVFGFTIRVVTSAASLREPTSVAAIAVCSVAGFILVRLWWKALEAGAYWCDRWEDLLRQIEPSAFGPLAVLRDIDNHLEQPPIRRARSVARATVLLFVGLWTLSSLVVILTTTLSFASRAGGR